MVFNQKKELAIKKYIHVRRTTVFKQKLRLIFETQKILRMKFHFILETIKRGWQKAIVTFVVIIIAKKFKHTICKEENSQSFD